MFQLERKFPKIFPRTFFLMAGSSRHLEAGRNGRVNRAFIRLGMHRCSNRLVPRQCETLIADGEVEAIRAMGPDRSQ
jgi:hypothetical protein